MAKLIIKRWPRTPSELHAWIKTVWGIAIPRVNVCPDHIAPFDALAEAYFGRTPLSIWRASRGLGGKSFMLGTLSLTEAVTFGVEVTVLGGSAAQSMRVHECTQMLWASKYAPRTLLIKEPTRYETKLRNNAHIRALMASTRSVRGPHPARLRLDEIDEMDLDILEAALGQPMPQRGVESQTVCSSTHQYPDGTVTEMLKRTKDHPEWGNHVWCTSIDTPIVTSSGNIPIQKVTTDHKVLTRDGWKDVQHVTFMGFKPTVRLVIGGHELVVTHDHLVAVPGGWCEAGRLQVGDEVVTYDGDVPEGRVPEVRWAEGRSSDDLPWMQQPWEARCGVESVEREGDGACLVLPALRSEAAQSSVQELPQVLRRSSASGQEYSDQEEHGLGTCAQLRYEVSTDQGRDEGGGSLDLVGVGVSDAGADAHVHGGLLPTAARRDRGGLRVASHTPGRQGAGRTSAQEAHEALPDDRAVVGFGVSVVASTQPGIVVAVYDIGVEEAHEFIADGVVVHNCYRESMGTEDNPGWLSPVEVQRKKAIMPKAMWDAEFEMQEPSFEGRAIDETAINFTFDPAHGTYKGEPHEYIIVEGPDQGNRYITGVDWAKERDWTVIRTFKDEGMVWREVAFERLGRISWPNIVSRVNERMEVYPGTLAYDNTGLGNVVGDYLRLPKKTVAIPIDMLGRRREVLFNEYISALENHHFKCPRIDFAYSEHRYCVAEGTMILTDRGEVPVEDVTTEMMVATRKGWRRVLHRTDMGVKPTVDVTVDGRTLTLTGDHRVATGSTWTEASSLVVGDLVSLVALTASPGAGGRDDGVLGRELMPPLAVGHGGLTGNEGRTAHDVLPMSDSFQMVGIAARPDAAEMVRFQASGHVTFPQSIGDPVRELLTADVAPGVAVLVDGAIPEPARRLVAEMGCGDAAGDVRLVHVDSLAARAAAFRPVLDESDATVGAELPGLGCGLGVVSHVVDSITPSVRVYDIGVEDEHEFVANGIVVHNCTSNDLYGNGHPPDSLVAGALAWHVRNEGRSVTVPPILVDAFAREQSPWRF